MTKLRTYRMFTFAPARSLKKGNIGKLSFAKVACIIFVFCVVTAIVSPAQTFKTLASFDGTDGANPYTMSLAQGLDGTFYGTTFAGGANGAGTVFKVTPTGALTNLYSFCSQTNCPDGAYPYAGLVLATDGTFYGTTPGGGIRSSYCVYQTGCGTVFKITAGGNLTTLYTFCGKTNCADGGNPLAGLVQATDGNLYGTTAVGGTYDQGEIFKITAGGKLTVFYSFSGAAGSGFEPVGGLIQGKDGNLYGTTVAGGTGSRKCYGDVACGTVFKITLGGKLTYLYGFSQTDGAYPEGALVQAADGTLYGTTSEGINGGCVLGLGCGTVFKISPNGSGFATLYPFCSKSGCTDGENPYAGLVQATDGNLYGTTPFGGMGLNCGGGGTVFKITPGGKLTTVYTYDCNPLNGDEPYGGLVQATNGTFYGTFFYGGVNTNCPDGCGAVFRISEGLVAFVQTIPSAGKAGTKVIILGNNLKGTTNVDFNGTTAAFKVVSKTEIKTSVPSGATTGTVEVTTPKRTLKSNVVFRVIK